MKQELISLSPASSGFGTASKSVRPDFLSADLRCTATLTTTAGFPKQKAALQNTEINESEQKIYKYAAKIFSRKLESRRDAGAGGQRRTKMLPPDDEESGGFCVCECAGDLVPTFVNKRTHTHSALKISPSALNII